MKKFLACLSILILWNNLSAQQNPSIQMGKIALQFHLDANGTPIYEVSFNGKAVIRPSQMGFRLNTDTAFYRDFELTDMQQRNFDENWNPVWGEVKTIRNNGKEMVVRLKSKHGNHYLLNIFFRAYEDGAAFRYEFPQQPGLKYFIVEDEMTTFSLTGNHKTFWIPGDYDTNEYLYTTSSFSEIDNRKLVASSTDIAVRTAPDPQAVQTPLMMKSADGLYINIHEAALVGFSSMQLHADPANYTLRASLVPDAYGNKCYLHAPAKSPWRTIIIADNAPAILNSKMILNLNDPSVITETSWIKPMKFCGVWWEMQTGKSGWNYADNADQLDKNGQLIPNGRHGGNTANVKKYIDFAAANKIQGVLVEGWNVGWEDWFGNWKEKVFDFTRPYPDFDVRELSRYAASKGIELIMHNETSGSASDYERQLDTAYRFMNLFGYKSVKTGYVGRIIPRGEHHDGQWMIEHYQRVAQKAADHHVMLDAHEPVRPTGLQRTYPNWLACEAGRGNEYNAFSTGSPPEHETILPFTRLMGGPMDYTPGIFKMKGYNHDVPDRQMHSTLCKQLALYVTLYSPLQMAADLPENYQAHMDAFQFIRDVATDWDDTKIIAAEPGDFITIARKEKNKTNWFVGAITDEQGRKAEIPMNFLDAGQQWVATIYRDAANADWKDNPEAYTIEQFLVGSDTRLQIPLAPGGGAAISIRLASPSELKSVKKYR